MSNVAMNSFYDEQAKNVTHLRGSTGNYLEG